MTEGRKRNDLPVEALWDLIRILHKDGVLPYDEAPFNNDMCHYHVHQNRVCYKD